MYLLGLGGNRSDPTAQKGSLIRDDCHVNSSTQLARFITPEKFSWSLQGSGSVTEAQNFYITGTEGEFLFLQVAYSNLGWSPSCQVSSRYFNPALGINKFISETFAASDMKLTDEKTSVAIGGIQIKQLQGKYSVVYQHADLRVVMDLKPIQTGGFSMNGGTTYYGLDGADGHVNTKYFPYSEASGIVQCGPHSKTFSGAALIVHVYHGLKPHQSTREAKLVAFKSKDMKSSIMMLDIETPESYGRHCINHGSMVLNGALVGVSVKNFIEFGPKELDVETGYEIPTSFRYQWKGETFDGREFCVEMELKARKLMDKIDVLSNLPLIIRKLIQTFVTKPFVYQWFEEVVAHVTIGEEKYDIPGSVMHEFAILNSQ